MVKGAGLTQNTILLFQTYRNRSVRLPDSLKRRPNTLWERKGEERETTGTGHRHDKSYAPRSAINARTTTRTTPATNHHLKYISIHFTAQGAFVSDSSLFPPFCRALCALATMNRCISLCRFTNALPHCSMLNALTSYPRPRLSPRPRLVRFFFREARKKHTHPDNVTGRTLLTTRLHTIHLQNSLRCHDTIGTDQNVNVLFSAFAHAQGAKAGC